MTFAVLRLLYLAILLACIALVAWRGGRDERLGLAILVVSSLLTVPAEAKDLRIWWHGINVGLLAVDLGALTACGWLMLASDRFWPLYMTAFQLAAVMTSLVQALRPNILPHVYLLAAGFWAYLWIVALLIGTGEHRWRVGVDRRVAAASGPG